MPSRYTKKMFAHCVGECARLASQEFFKNDDLLMEDLAKALARSADNEEHATLMISTWKGATKDMLHESELSQLAERTRIHADFPAGCSRCIGSDYIIIEVNGKTGAKRCSCPRGRRLAKMDQAKNEPGKGFDWVSFFAQPGNQPSPTPPASDSAQQQAATEPPAQQPPPQPEARENSPQLISAEEVEQARELELLRRATQSK